ncbi:Protein ABHD13 [Seminavis robusta]|uniref:Protein ABHD13 n=1 Tax=Seminavis robusta TaxID=568900 RepID=A0A9N8EIH4_9STRA|nr:Protein ABHD13 [Seminavis robusta]|eukprot:Sro988_g228350.1 Protein ABHD13 (479) ;mRNA; r:14155-15591
MLRRPTTVAAFVCLRKSNLPVSFRPVAPIATASYRSSAFGNSLSGHRKEKTHVSSSSAKDFSRIHCLPSANNSYWNTNNMSSAGFATGTNGDDLGAGLLSSAIPFLWNVMTVIVGLAAVLGGLLYAKQDSLLYYPEIGGIPKRPSQNPRRYRSPDEHQVPFETHMIKCADGVRVHSWLLLRKPSSPQSPTASGKMPTIVFFHGNAGNIGLRLPNALQMLQYLDAHVLLVEYRGYGDSDDAQVNEAGLKLDAEASLRFIRTHPKVDPDQIFIFGRSLGGSVAFHLAMYAQQQGIPIAGVMVENTFLSIAAMVDTLMPYVAPFKQLILRIGWRSEQIVPLLTVPVLYLAGAQDELVPHAHMMKLYKKTQSSRYLKMHIIENGTHNESWLQGGTEYWAQVKDFMKNAAKLQQALGGAAPVVAPIQPSIPELPPAPHTVEKTIGQDIGSPSIPIMPSRLLGMMSEAVSGGNNNAETPAKKEN